MPPDRAVRVIDVYYRMQKKAHQMHNKKQVLHHQQHLQQPMRQLKRQPLQQRHLY
jgi:hypothetical protein